jgi:3-oxo-5-alpha-steroid 4-dehydrogenase 3
MASGIQYDAHVYLASLKKYTLPEHPIFNLLICPHYSAEAVIYISLAILGAPDSQLVNKTLLAAVIFVMVNLGVSAELTKRWYIETYGEKKVEGRWTMIPGIY